MTTLCVTEPSPHVRSLSNLHGAPLEVDLERFLTPRILFAPFLPSTVLTIHAALTEERHAVCSLEPRGGPCCPSTSTLHAVCSLSGVSLLTRDACVRIVRAGSRKPFRRSTGQVQAERGGARGLQLRGTERYRARPAYPPRFRGVRRPHYEGENASLL